MERYLERFIEKDILSWKNNPNHRALEINGGRQIGKTTTLKKFVESNYENVIWIDLSRPNIRYTVEDIIHNLKVATDTMSIEFIKKFWNIFSLDYKDSNDTVIVIDEIQESRDVYELLRPLNRSLKCDIIFTGSYLLRTKEWFYPAGDIDSLTMYPISFEEFINIFHGYKYYNEKSIEEITRDKLSWYQTACDVYCDVGGYPDVVLTYLNNEDYRLSQSKLIEMIIREIKTRVDSVSEFTIIENCFRPIILSMISEKKGNRRLISS